MARRYFISRHPGAAQWAREAGLGPITVVTHIDTLATGPDDVVMGTLPVHLAAQVCASGARYYNLTLDLPEAWRGRELEAAALRACGARLERFEVRRVPSGES